MIKDNKKLFERLANISNVDTAELNQILEDYDKEISRYRSSFRADMVGLTCFILLILMIILGCFVNLNN